MHLSCLSQIHNVLSFFFIFIPTHPSLPSLPQVEQDTSWLKLLTVMFEVIVVPHVAISIFALGWIWVHPALCCLVWLHVREEQILHVLTGRLYEVQETAWKYCVQLKKQKRGREKEM